MVKSFEINHIKMKAGLFLFSVDDVSYDAVTTFDLRLKRPYNEEVMDTGSIHALEHLCNDYLHNDALWGEKIILFAPNGSRTGFYLVVKGALTVEEIYPLVERTFDHISEFEGEVPGATPEECGFCIDIDLERAKIDAALYYNLLIEAKKENFTYPKKREKKPAKKAAKKE